MSFASFCFDLLAVNETQLHEIIADSEVSIDEKWYHLPWPTAKQQKWRWGFAFIIRSHINYNVCKDLVFD